MPNVDTRFRNELWHFGTFVLDNNPQEQLQMPIINETLDNYVTIMHGWPRSNY